MVGNALARYRRWRLRGKLERKWGQMTPGQHIALLVDMLNRDEDLRRAFREAIFGRLPGGRQVDHLAKAGFPPMKTTKAAR